MMMAHIGNIQQVGVVGLVAELCFVSSSASSNSEFKRASWRNEKPCVLHHPSVSKNSLCRPAVYF